MQHIMVDLETLGRVSGVIVLSVGAVAFDPIAGKMGNEFYASITLEDQDRMGLKVDPDTVRWWMKDSITQSARDAAFSGDHSLIATLNGFDDFWRREQGKFFWCHGAPFDFPIFEHLYKINHRRVPFVFQDVRDTRTIYHLAGVKVARDANTHHNALADARAQAEAVIRAYGNLKITTE